MYVHVNDKSKNIERNLTPTGTANNMNVGL